MGLSDYRPISLVSSVYKKVAKVLSRRLRKVLLKIISEVQTAFLSRRCILDGVLITNEVVDCVSEFIPFLLLFLQDEADLIDRNDQQQFLASADFLSNYGMPTLISNMQAAASEVLKGKQLKDLFNTTVLHETTVQILDMFMSMGSPHHWVEYLMPEDPNFYKLVAFSNSDSTDPSDSTKFDRLMVETRAVLSSAEFGNMVDVSLNTAVDALMEDIKAHLGEGNSLPGIPLAKLLPRLAQISPLLLEEPSKNRFIQIIQTIPEVELFFTLLYSKMPTS
ncbi:peroxisome biogenesis protein 3-2-like [Camellia sinensis]|uniref:peroxisome biogenesis protein 3-2-like n=1 Tax=Camellia sinensis TaxID=4442 RepID=UPI0010355C13|nr:peroxisome biogenesis protein 3-2-like [Camellia sinensis]